jgi:hypothetical protein
MAKLPQLAVVVLATLFGAGLAMADYIVIDRDTIIDYTIEPDGDEHPIRTIGIFDGTNPDPPTIVDVVEPADIRRDVDVGDSSVLNVYGGRITATENGIEAFDESVVNFFGGEVIGVHEAFGAYGNSTINVYEGLFRGHSVEAEAAGTINIFGGAFETQIYTSEVAQVHIHGGSISRLEIAETSWITVYGTGFNYPYGPISDDAGVLTGVLSDGQPINAEFRIDRTFSEDVSVVLAVPESSTLVLMTTSAVGLSVIARRRRRR